MKIDSSSVQNVENALPEDSSLTFKTRVFFCTSCLQSFNSYGVIQSTALNGSTGNVLAPSMFFVLLACV